MYLVQFTRAKCCPSISPYCLKVETWLRMAGVDYEVRLPRPVDSILHASAPAEH